MKKNKKQMVTIIGNIASGKSTLLSLISQELDAKTIDADDLFQTTDPFSKPYLVDVSRWAFTNELWLTFERVKLLQQKSSYENGQGTVFVDSGLLMSWVYAHSHFLVGNIREEEWHFYTNLYDHLSKELVKNTQVIYLEYPIEILLKRLKKRGRDYELTFYTREYLGQLELGLRELEKKLANSENMPLKISCAEFQDFENNADEKAKIIKKIIKFLEI